MDGLFTGPYPNRVGPSFVNNPVLTGAFDVFDSGQPLGQISTTYTKWKRTEGRGPPIG